jgi:UDP-hydrolysing UDP-N-acetyl-D-glucosamine 2-epimerase
MMRKLCVVTGSRSDYGLLSGIIGKINNSKEFELQIIASAMHLTEEYGYTYKEIESDGFNINSKVEMDITGSSTDKIAKSIAKGISGFTDALLSLKPDLVIILGDRFEALAAAQTAMIMKIPIAHIHGGEVTEGAVDESIRHSITKMSNLHFVSTESFKNRLIAMGEQPNRIFISGAPGIDNIKNMINISKEDLEKKLNFKFGKLNFLITFHPVTLSLTKDEQEISELLEGLDYFDEAKIIITFPNADSNSDHIISKLKKYASKNAHRILLVESLGYKRYLQTLKYIDCVIGNSSSGIIEVPSFKIPTINIGDRQKGRPQAKSVINCVNNKEAIIESVKSALSDDFKNQIKSIENIYGKGNSSKIIISTLSKLNFNDYIRKPFYE